MSYKGKIQYLDLNKLPRPDKRFSVGRILAQGHCAKICEAIDHENGGQKVAIKIFSNLDENLDIIEEEFRIFKDLSRHDNFPTFYGAFFNKYDKDFKNELWLVMEYCAGGSLADLLYNMSHNHRKLSEPIVGYIVRELINALSYLHMNHIMHRDIKAANILLTADGQIKITDFGFARHLKHTMSRRNTSIGSCHWMAPEVVTNGIIDPAKSQAELDGKANDEEFQTGYDNHCDVWSLGITTIELADGEPPLWNLHPVRALFQIVHNPPPGLKKPGEWSTNFKDFIAECLIKNPDHRPVMMELGEHPFIQEIPEDSSMLRNQLKTLASKHACTKDFEMPFETVILNGKMKTGPKDEFKRMYPDDLAAVDRLDKERVLLTLGNRYSRGQFQTYVGDVLLIINPQQETNLYDNQHHERYVLKARSDEEPHIFSVVDVAWQDMLHHKEHQNIVLTGDRNSGKSFNFNQVIRHLCHIAKGNPAMTERIEQLPLILDCFGNAATEGNANSSRHLRYLELTFTESGKLSGAIAYLYLLEKWRISPNLSKSSRNYHIFYYVYYGLKKEGLLQRYHLDGRRFQFRLLPIGETDAELSYYLSGYQKLKEYLRHWDMEKEEQEFIFQTIAAILLIGELDFEGGETATVQNPDVLNKIASLLSVNPAKLGWALCNSTVMVKGDSEVVSNTEAQAEDVRDALARGIYSRLVDWLVNALNLNLCLGRKVFGEKHTMGVIDPAGFDTNQRKNSFEQLIYNIVNEHIAYHYNEYIFNKEMKDCKEEGIQIDTLTYRDNKSKIDAMLAKPDGLLAIVDDLTRSSKADGSDIIEKLSQSIPTEHLSVNDADTFTVHHSCGDVRYRVNGFPEKNRDFLSVELIEVMRHSANQRLSSIFFNPMTKTGHVTADPPANHPANKAFAAATKSKGFHTMSQAHYSQTRQMQTQAMRARQTLMQLLQKLAHGTPHYVRCIRRSVGQPNMPGVDKGYLADQIRAFNLIPTIHIRKHGFPSRIPFAEFLRRYQFLAFDFEETVEMTGDNCRLLLLRLKMEGWMLGKNKVFLKYYTEEYLSRLYEEQVRKIVKIQAVMRAVMAKLRKKRGITGPTRSRRSSTSSNMSRDDAAVAIQKNYRGYSVRKSSVTSNSSNSGLKRHKCAPIREEAANTIQYYWRKWKGKTLFQQLLLYRADKQQHLTYFCQQVHVYNQEFAGNTRKTTSAVDESKITSEGRTPLSPELKPSMKKKLPLILKNRHFVDTTFMCVEAIDKMKMQLKMKQVEKQNQARNNAPVKPSNVASSTPGKQPISYQPIARPTHLPGKLQMTNKFGAQAPIKSPPVNGKDNDFNKPSIHVSDWNGRSPVTPPAKPASSYGLSKPVAPKVASTPSYIKLADHRQIAKEIEKKAAEFGKVSTEAEDSAPFNFQAMLKKTDYSRGSMKRLKGGQGKLESDAAGPLLNSNKTGNSVVYQSKPAGLPSANARRKYQAPSPNKIEIAPGLVISDGQEADL